MSKQYRARSLLYRRQILQEDIPWEALDEIYKIYMLLHRSDLNISEIFRQTSFRIFWQNLQKFVFLILFIDFRERHQIIDDSLPYCWSTTYVLNIS